MLSFEIYYCMTIGQISKPLQSSKISERWHQVYIHSCAAFVLEYPLLFFFLINSFLHFVLCFLRFFFLESNVGFPILNFCVYYFSSIIYSLTFAFRFWNISLTLFFIEPLYLYLLQFNNYLVIVDLINKKILPSGFFFFYYCN